jgi:hypothetical protein
MALSLHYRSGPLSREVFMVRRIAFAFFAVLAVAAGGAEAVTLRDVIELSKAGLSDPVLLALIEVDRGIFPIDTATMKQLKQAGVSEAVIVAMIRSGRTPPAQDPDPAQAPPPRPEPQVVVIDHRDAPAPVAVPYPVAVPVYVPMRARRFPGDDTIVATFPTDAGIVRARLPVPPNCVKAEPVYWGFGGKLRPDSWPQPPTVVCR